MKINNCKCGNADIHLTTFFNYDDNEDCVFSDSTLGYLFECYICENVGTDSDNFEDALKNWNEEND